MPHTQVCKQLPLKKYRGMTKHIVTSCEKKTKEPFSSLSRDALLKRKLNRNQEEDEPQVRRSKSTTTKEICPKLGVPLSILGQPSSSSSSDLTLVGVNGIKKATLEKKPVNASADNKSTGQETDFLRMYYRALGVPLSTRAPAKSTVNHTFENLKLLGDVSEKLSFSVDASVKNGIEKTLGDASKYERLSRNSSASSCNIELAHQLLSWDCLPGPMVMRLQSLNEPLTKSDDQSMMSNNPSLTYVGVDSLLGETVDVSSQSISLESLRLSTSLPMMESNDQSAKLCNSGSTSALLGTQSSDGSSQMMHSSIGSFIGPLSKSDDHSMCSTVLDTLLRGSSDALSVPCDLPPADEPTAVTSLAIIVQPDIQRIDANAYNNILAIVAKDKSTTNKYPVREGSPRNKTYNNTDAKQYFEKSKKDVIFGRGTGPNLHNALFREEVGKHRADYLAGHDAEQKAIILGLMNFVKCDKGLFLKEDPSTKQWYEATDKEVFPKIRQMIREHKTGKQRQKSTKSKKKATKMS